MNDQVWFQIFSGALVLVCALEIFIPQSLAPPERVRRWPVNVSLALFEGVIASLVPALPILAARWAAERQIGFCNWIAIPVWVALPIAIILQSLATYALHVLSHVNPFLWRLHKVHHSDKYIDATSTLRHHPGETVVVMFFFAVTAMICGLSPFAMIVYGLAEQIFDLLQHANLRIPEKWDRLARVVLMTPALHRIHHSNIKVETDSNYGDIFPFWDRLFGTYRGEPLAARARIEFGLDDVDKKQAEDFLDQLTLPWRA
jgi:sterol desaturase/sphingolipid hydroxylase (fatty acid hydroxylase superfamily)